MHLTDGTRFSPQFIENKLKFSPYIKECVCLGHERDFIALMICIDYANVGKWAEGRRLNYTTYTDLAGSPRSWSCSRRKWRRSTTRFPKRRGSGGSCSCTRNWMRTTTN